MRTGQRSPLYCASRMPAGSRRMMDGSSRSGSTDDRVVAHRCREWGHPPHQAHQAPRWSGMDWNVQFRCRLATVRGFVRVGAIYRRTVIRAVASLGEPIELSDGVRGAPHSPPGSGDVTPRLRCQRCERIAEAKARISPPPAASQLFDCESGGTLRIWSESITEATTFQARSSVATRS
jgi:hypothetical protein